MFLQQAASSYLRQLANMGDYGLLQILDESRTYKNIELMMITFIAHGTINVNDQ